MKIVVPKDSAEEARVYLQAWMDLHEGPGLARAKKMVFTFRLLSVIAGAVLAMGVIFAWHPIAIALSGIVLGYAGAETGALMSRLRSWPHNEKYFDWPAIEEALKASRDSAPN